MSIPAFLGAYGWGAKSAGGRSGQVIHVTNLNASGAGSLLAALQTAGPRIIVFDVAGNITLSGADFTQPYCTIAGQTAPGDGICIDVRDREFYLRKTHDWIIRYLRFRSLSVSGRDVFGCYGSESAPADPSYNHIIDHCSFSWGGDEVIGNSIQTDNITYQWCMIYENIKSDHNMAMNISSRTYNVSIHHCIFAHCAERMPKMDGGLDGHPALPSGEDFRFDAVNNVIYNWKDACLHIDSDPKINAINNYFKRGPETTNYPTKAEFYVVNQFATARLYAVGNFGPSENTGDNWDDGYIRNTRGVPLTKTNSLYSATKLQASSYPIPEQSAADAYTSVLAEAGASRGLNADGSWRNIRDAADQRVVNDIVAGTGNYITNPNQVGGLPALSIGAVYIDTDGDGMPDEWELAHGLDPNDPSDGPQIGPSGYSNLELFLNGIMEEPMSVITDLQAHEAVLRQMVTVLLAQADAVAKTIVDLRAADVALDAAADVIEIG